jgi:hypothetical protein
MSQPTSKRQIAVSETLKNLIVTTNTEVRKLEEEIKTKSQQVISYVTGVCINDGVDLQKEGIYFSEDFQSIHVYDLPVKEDKAEEVKTEKPSKAKR